MNTIAKQIWNEDDGVLTFEWTLLVVVVVFGIVGGLAAARDVMIDEMGDTAEAILAFDQSYSFAGIPGVIDASVYVDTPQTFEDCARGGVPGQAVVQDGGS